MTLPARDVRTVRRLILDAVLVVEEADLRLTELAVPRLREELLRAATLLTRAADGLTDPAHLPRDDE